MNYYERHIGDYAKDASHLSMLEDGAYTRLLDRYYATEKGIPSSEAYRVVRARTKEEREAVDAVLREFFHLSNDVWIKNRCEEEIAIAQRRIESARENGIKGGRPRKNPIQTQQEPSRFHPDNPIETDWFQSGSVLETGTKALQSPIPSPQTPDLNPRPPDIGYASLGQKRPRANGSSHVGMEKIPPEAVGRIFEHWRTVHGHPRAKLDEKRQKLIGRALLAYSESDLCQAISGYKNSPHHAGQNEHATVYDDIEVFLRDAKHIDAGLKFYTDPPRTDLSAQTRRIIAQTEDWVPPEVRNATR